MAEEVLRQGIHPLFPWKLYINNVFVGDEANSIEDVKRILSRVGLKLVAAQKDSEIKFVDRSNYTVLLIENGTFVWPMAVQGKRYVRLPSDELNF